MFHTPKDLPIKEYQKWCETKFDRLFRKIEIVHEKFYCGANVYSCDVAESNLTDAVLRIDELQTKIRNLECELLITKSILSPSPKKLKNRKK